MKNTFPVQVTFNGVQSSAEVEELVGSQVEHLTRFHPRIHGCWVVIGRAEGHARTGGYHAQLRVAIPGNDVVVNQQRAEPHPDMTAAVLDAFQIAERMLEENRARGEARRREGDARAED